MPKDYRQQKKSRSPKSSPSKNFGWTVFGILIGSFIVILFYWKQVILPTHHLASANKTAVTTGLKKPEKPVAAPAPTNTTTATATTPQFDFYTVLPQMQVASQNKASTPSSTQSPAATTSSSTASNALIPVPQTSSASSTPSTSSPAVSASTPRTIAPAPTPSESSTVALLPLPAEPAEKTAPAPDRATHVPAAVTATTPADTSALPAVVPSKTKKSSPAALAATPKTNTSAVTSKTNTPATKSPAVTNYLLQLGVLKNYADADRLKAELTMLGLDVYIQPYKVNGQLHSRVLMGPYASKSMALQQQALLQKEHVMSVLIKP